ncbi:MAG TPA: hypothetical protein VE988_25410 [Gemmataceae bacterium]|nr:hypothetical protein [Gemmataceae bacterium]
MNRWIAIWASFAVVTLVFLASSRADDKAQNNPTIEEIKRAWRTREEAVKSFSAAWKVTHTYAKGSLLTPDMSETINPQKLLAPTEDMTFDARFDFKVAPKEQQKTRYQFHWQTFDPLTSKLNPLITIEVFDGKTNTILDNPESPQPISSVKPGGYSLSEKRLETRPLILAFRPSAMPLDDMNPNTLEIIDEKAAFGNARCVVLKSKGSKWAFWVDPLQGNSVVRCFSQSKDGTPRVIIDIDWIEKSGVWIPKAWHISQFWLDGGLRYYTTTQEVDIALNPDFGVDDFELKFGPRTLIIDGHETGKAMKYSIITDDGQKKDVKVSDLRNDGVYQSTSKVTIYAIWTGIVALLAVAACGFMAWRKGLLPFKGRAK